MHFVVSQLFCPMARDQYATTSDNFVQKLIYQNILASEGGLGNAP